MNFHQELISYIENNFSFWKKVFTPAPFIVSDAVIEIKKETFHHIDKIVSAFYKLRNNKDYVTEILSNYPGLKSQNHYSVLMSFDFHVTPDGPKLIEINTNASFALLAFAVDQAYGKNYPNFLQSLQDSFLNDYKLFSGKSDLQNIAIVDEKPTEQKAFFEFLMYQKLFQSWLWNCDILDIKDIKEGYDFIYNRHTDFFLNLKQSEKLKTIYENKKSCVSPHPTEYALLADKMLFLKFGAENFLEKYISTEEAKIIRKCVPQTRELDKIDLAEVLKNKKQFIFKPKNSFGGKAVYRGESLSNNKFEELKNNDYLVQEAVHPPKHNELKWDLRCYVYNGEVQMSGVRAYHGQITNFKELGGGFARIKQI